MFGTMVWDHRLGLACLGPTVWGWVLGTMGVWDQLFGTMRVRNYACLGLVVWDHRLGPPDWDHGCIWDHACLGPWFGTIVWDHGCLVPPCGCLGKLAVWDRPFGAGRLGPRVSGTTSCLGPWVFGTSGHGTSCLGFPWDQLFGLGAMHVWDEQFGFGTMVVWDHGCPGPPFGTMGVWDPQFGTMRVWDHGLGPSFGIMGV